MGEKVGYDFRYREKYFLKLEWTYNPLFRSEPFGNDVIIREIMCLVHNKLWYTTSHDYYLKIVCDFYDKFVMYDKSRLLHITYKNNTHTISNKVSQWPWDFSLGIYGKKTK